MGNKLALALALLLGCDEGLVGGGGGIEDGFGTTLTEMGGCGDVVLYAANLDDTLTLLVRLPELIDQARDNGGVLTQSFGLPAPDLPTVLVRQGEHTSHDQCNDALFEEIRIDTTWVAAQGTVEVEVRTEDGTVEPWNNPASVDVDLVDVVLEVDGQSVELGPVTFEGIFVGWLAG